MTNLELIGKAYQEGIQIQQEKTVRGTFVPSDAMYDDLAEDGSNIEDIGLWANESYDNVTDIDYNIIIDDLRDWDKNVIKKAGKTATGNFYSDDYSAQWLELNAAKMWSVLRILLDKE